MTKKVSTLTIAIQVNEDSAEGDELDIAQEIIAEAVQSVTLAGVRVESSAWKTWDF